MTDAVIVAIVAAVSPTLAAIAGVLVSLRNAKKLTEVHQATDGNLSKVSADLKLAKDDLALANKRIEDLHRLFLATRAGGPLP